MAEARTEDEEESLRESRGARNPRLSSVSSERAERNKPEQRHTSSQGALSSIRAVIKRTSNRPTAQTDHNRDRRRPEITILSAEPLATNSWFPGPPGAFPPPPPPAQPSWTGGGLTVHLPPPSYEQVIREKSREQNTHPSLVSASASSSTSPTPHRSSVTIATQTDTDFSASKNCTGPPARRPPKPPRPSLPLAPKPTRASPSQTHTLIELDKPDLPFSTQTPVTTHDSEIWSKPLSEQCGVQTDFWNTTDELATLETTHAVTDSSPEPPVKREVSACPRPRPRSKAVLQPATRVAVQDQPMTREVKVQTLVRLKEDGAENIFAGFTDSSSDASSNKYLQELLDAFGCDEHSYQGNQSSGSDQSEMSDEEKVEEKGNVASENFIAATVPSEPSEPLKKPEPKPRTQNTKQVTALKPSEPMQNVEEIENYSEDKSKHGLDPPVSTHRPLLTNEISEGNKPEEIILPQPPRPPVAARRSLAPARSKSSSSGLQIAIVPYKLSVDNHNVDEQARNSSTPVKPTPVTSASSGKCPTQTSQVPAEPLSHRRPPPPSTTSAQVADVDGVRVSKAPVSSVPAIPPRTSEGKMLPPRPPPMKLSKSARSSSVPDATSQLPSQRVPKRGPPLPPRPKPGHPLYKDYTSKVPQRNTKMTYSSTKPQKHNLQEEELLLDLDDTHIPTPPSVSREVKGPQDGCDVHSAVRDEPIFQHMQNQEGKGEKQEEQQPQPNTVKCLSRFAFEGQEDELTFREGDIISLIEYVNEEWGRGSLDGHTGLFPLNFVQELPSPQRKPTPESLSPPVSEEERKTGRTMFDFTPESEDELCLKVGDIVSALEEVDEDWFIGEFDGKRGIVPKNFIQVL